MHVLSVTEWEDWESVAIVQGFKKTIADNWVSRDSVPHLYYRAVHNKTQKTEHENTESLE